METETQGQWLQLLRTKLKCNTGEFATRLGVSRMTVHRWESETKGSKPTLAQATLLAKLAKCSLEEVARVFAE